MADKSQALAIAYSIRRHAMKKRLPQGDQDSAPAASPLKSSLAEHLANKMRNSELDETFPEQGEEPAADDFLSADMDPASSGLVEAETDTYPTNGTEHEIFDDSPKKKMAAMAAAMRKRRAEG